MQRLGDISMSFYMVHWILAQYVCALIGWDLHWVNRTLSPLQTTLLIVCSLVVGFVLTETFEKPAGNALRTKQAQTPSASANA